MVDCEHLKKPYIHDGCPACEITQLKADLAKREGQLAEAHSGGIELVKAVAKLERREAVLREEMTLTANWLIDQGTIAARDVANRLRAALEVK